MSGLIGSKKKQFTRRIFWEWVATAVFHSVVSPSQTFRNNAQRGVRLTDIFLLRTDHLLLYGYNFQERPYPHTRLGGWSMGVGYDGLHDHLDDSSWQGSPDIRVRESSQGSMLFLN